MGGRLGCWLEEEDGKGVEAEKDSSGANDRTDVGKVLSLQVDGMGSSTMSYPFGYPTDRSNSHLIRVAAER